MADNSKSHAEKNSPEAVAYQLMLDIAAIEERSIGSYGANKPDRKWLLDTYSECLLAVRGGRVVREE